MNIIVASHNEETLKKYFDKSLLPDDSVLTVMRGYKNVSKAYNDALMITDPGLTMFVHHDVVLPKGWFDRLDEIIKKLPDDWGVIGVAGASLEHSPIHSRLAYKGNIINDNVEWKHGAVGKGAEFETVQTLDEMLFIIKDINMRFDENLGNHFYCADICMKELSLGKRNYVINNCCFHSGGENKVKDEKGEFIYSEDFYRSRDEIAKKYQVPFATTCTIINYPYATNR